jgi:hypothetical protein
LQYIYINTRLLLNTARHVSSPFADVVDYRAAPAQFDGPSSTNYGPHQSATASKLDPRYDSDLDHRGTTTDSSNHGPHHTNVANKLDPRVDSDRDHRAHREYPDGTGSTGYGHESTNYRPHPSNAANKLDPTVDSDRDHRANQGSTNYGPRSMNTANKLDPTVDSDRDHRASQTSTNYGPQSTNIGNKLDPRVDSDLDHRGPGRTNRNRPLILKLRGSLLMTSVRSSSHDDLSRTDTFSAPARAGTMPHLHHDCPHGDPEGEELNSGGRYSRRSSKAQHAPRKFVALLAHSSGSFVDGDSCRLDAHRERA